MRRGTGETARPGSIEPDDGSASFRDQIRTLVENETLEDAGPFIVHLCEINAELEMGFTLTRDDITEREFRGLCILREIRAEVMQERKRQDDAIQARNAKQPRTRHF